VATRMCSICVSTFEVCAKRSRRIPSGLSIFSPKPALAIVSASRTNECSRAVSSAIAGKCAIS